MKAPTCPDTGQARARCDCDLCAEFRHQSAIWNARLANQNLAVNRGELVRGRPPRARRLSGQRGRPR